MGKPQNSPEERINPELEEGQRETRRVSVLVNFELLPGTDISHWNSQLHLDDRAASGMFWGFLDKMLELGWASRGSPNQPILVLRVPEKDAEWLPAVSQVGLWLSKMILLFLRLCWFGKDEPRTDQLKAVGQSDNLYQVEGKPVSYALKALPETFGTGTEWPWAVVTLEEPGGALVQLHIPSYDDEATVKERCEASMEGRTIWASGYWYDSGAGRVFRVKEWRRQIDPPAGSALEEIGEIL